MLRVWHYYEMCLLTLFVLPLSVPMDCAPERLRPYLEVLHVDLSKLPRKVLLLFDSCGR